MRSRSAYDLINDVRARCDQQTLNGQTAYITDQSILEWLNQAWAELYDLLSKTGEHYYLRQQNITALNGCTDYPLPDDWYKTVGVDILVGGFWQNCHRMQFERRNDYQTVTGDWTWPVDVFYDLWGPNLHFIPVPNGLYPIRHWYYPAPYRMTLSDGGSPPGSASMIDGVSGWEQYAIDWAAQKCAERDENMDLSQMLGIAMGAKRQHIITMASSRNPGEAPVTRIVRGRQGTVGPNRWWRW
jgi:hypothetical protein